MDKKDLQEKLERIGVVWLPAYTKPRPKSSEWLRRDKDQKKVARALSRYLNENIAITGSELRTIAQEAFCTNFTDESHKLDVEIQRRVAILSLSVNPYMSREGIMSTPLDVMIEDYWKEKRLLKDSWKIKVDRGNTGNLVYKDEKRVRKEYFPLRLREESKLIVISFSAEQIE